MAQNLHPLTSTIFVVFFIFLFVSLPMAKSEPFSRTIKPETLGLMKEKLSHLHFYFHDTVSGRNPSAVVVAQAATTNTSSTMFGKTVMMDNPLTATPEISSKLVGRAQGIYAFASQSGIGLLMVLNLVFTERKYNGSTLSILGRNAIFSAVREMPILGGSGVFRFSRGYVQARTYSLNLKSKNAVVEWDVYVFHY